MISIALILGHTRPAPIPPGIARSIRGDAMRPANHQEQTPEQRRESIANWLRHNPESTVAEIAEWAEAPLQTIQRDLTLLRMDGLAKPVGTIKSRNGSSLCKAWSAT